MDSYLRLCKQLEEAGGWEGGGNELSLNLDLGSKSDSIFH